jgi:hypothetical protein
MDEEREREKWVNKCRSCGEHPEFTENEWTKFYSCRCGFTAHSGEEWNKTIRIKSERFEFRRQLEKLISKFSGSAGPVISLNFSWVNITDEQFELMKKLENLLLLVTKKKRRR